MPTPLRITLAVVLGLVAGSAANLALIGLGPMLIPPPPGADLTTAEGLKAAMPLLEARHFLVPFLAHAVGTLVGALVAALVATQHRARVAYAIGILFLCGGIAASVMIPAPAWFIALDLVAAYLPMAWLGLSISDRVRPRGAVPR